MDKLPDFQLILDQYQVDLKFVKLLSQIETSEDVLYRIETDIGEYFIYETDFVGDLSSIVAMIRAKINSEFEFIRVKAPLNSFTDYPQLKYDLHHKIPPDFDELKNFMGCFGGSKDYFFNFLVKKIN